jgi:putative transposase
VGGNGGREVALTWAGRYKSSILADPQAFLDAVTYVELNGVRAGLVARPEEYVGGSLFLREAGEYRSLQWDKQNLTLSPEPSR